MNFYAQLTDAYNKQLNRMGDWLLAEVVNTRKQPPNAAPHIPLPPGLVAQETQASERNPNEGPVVAPMTRSAMRKIRNAARDTAKAAELMSREAGGQDTSTELLPAAPTAASDGQPATASAGEDQTLPLHKDEPRAENPGPQTPERRKLRGRRRDLVQVGQAGAKYDVVVKNTFLDLFDGNASATSARSRGAFSSPAPQQDSFEKVRSPEEAKDEADELLQRQVDLALICLKDSKSDSLTTKTSSWLASILTSSKPSPSLLETCKGQLLEILYNHPTDAASLLQVLVITSGQDFLQLFLDNAPGAQVGPVTMQLKHARVKEVIPNIAAVWADYLQQSERTRNWAMEQSNSRIEATCSLLAEAPADSKAAAATRVFEALQGLPALGRSSGNQAQLSKWLIEQVSLFRASGACQTAVAGLAALAALSRQSGTLFGVAMLAEGDQAEEELGQLAVMKEMAMDISRVDDFETAAKSLQVLVHAIPLDEVAAQLLDLKMNQENKVKALQEVIREVEQSLDMDTWAQHATEEDNSDNSDPSYIAAVGRLNRLLSSGGLGSRLYSVLGRDPALRERVLRDKVWEFQGSSNSAARARFGFVFGLVALSSIATDQTVTPKDVKDNMKAVTKLTKLKALESHWEKTLQELVHRDFSEDQSADAHQVEAMASIARVACQLPSELVKAAVNKILDAVSLRVWSGSSRSDWMNFEHYALWAITEFHTHEGCEISVEGAATIAQAVGRTENAVQVKKYGDSLLRWCKEASA